METEMKEIIKEKVYMNQEGNCEHNARKSRQGFGMGLAGVLTGGVALLSQLYSGGGRGLFGMGSGSGVTLPENININSSGQGTDGAAAPTAFEAWEAACNDRLALTNELWAMKTNTLNQMYDHRNTDVAEKFSIWQGIENGNFALYKGYRDMGDGILQQMQAANFGLYKEQRDNYDRLSERINAIAQEVAVNTAIRPYQDKLLQCDISQAQANAINYCDRRTCRMITGEVVLPSTPTVTGFGSYTPCSASSVS